MKRVILGMVAAAAAAFAAQAAEMKPAVIYDMGGKFDKSFNESAYNGAEMWKKETGSEYREFEISDAAQREQALRRFAQDGNQPIVAMGFAQAAAVEKVAKEFPDLKFAIIDMVVDLPNVRSIVFKEQEGSYLVGLMAAMASKTGKGGFIGGMDIPLIRRFACGYKGGFMATNPKGEVFENMTGTTPEAWNDPVKGGELAKSQFDRGADVVYAAAGGTGIGVLQAAKDAGKLGIGVDSNQNGLQPGSVLTSMLKRVDIAVNNAFKDGGSDKWGGINVLGLKEGGVDYAVDDNNKALITPEMTAAVEKAKADIIAGTIEVHDFMADSACPY